MRTFLRMKNRLTPRLPEEFRGAEVRYPEELVETFLRRYTRPRDVVLDPFAGFGTTLLVAEAMGRTPVGVEYDARRVEYVRRRLRRPEAIIRGDSRNLRACAIPACDFVMTSPPFMSRGDPEDPFAGYALGGRGYAAYLEDMAAIFAQVREVMRPGALAVLEVSNLKDPGGVTTLAWDTARTVGASLRFEGEVVIGWDSYAYGYDHSYCLVFARPPDGG